eukprot:scaffold14966_cov61-Phaeocystis_antarctica.AAC.1
MTAQQIGSMAGRCGQRAWRGPGGSPRALGIQLAASSLRGPPLLPPPTQWREAAIALLHAPSRRVALYQARSLSSVSRAR